MSSFIDVTGQVLPTGVKVIQRVSRQPLRWLCKCQTCGSERIFDHSRVMAAKQGASGNVAQCDLSNCRLFGTASKPIPPTGRPKHEPSVTAVTSPVAVTAPAKRAPVPKPPDPLRREFERASAAQKHWGNAPMSFDSFRLLQEFKPEFFESMMANVRQFEAEQQRKAELEQLGAAIEKQFNDDFNKRWGIQMVGNVRRR
jgi:hypothetical protein